LTSPTETGMTASSTEPWSNCFRQVEGFDSTFFGVRRLAAALNA
jgi:hypothetical protein